jgi:hypothetical protein
MYRQLDPDKIVQTIRQLRDRIQERFPDAGLSKVAKELCQVSDEAMARATWIKRPNIPLRIAIGVLILVLAVILVGIFTTFKVATMYSNFSDFIQAVDASFNVLVLTSAAIFFLVTVEVRIKQKRALKMMHELRALAHIVDIHQLTKDPERILSPERNTSSSPTRSMTVFELARYLDYCSEMLSLIGKIAALYAQYFNDPVVLNAVDDIEDLTTGLSRKIWQKIMLTTQKVS